MEIVVCPVISGALTMAKLKSIFNSGVSIMQDFKAVLKDLQTRITESLERL